MSETNRPNPDALLRSIQREEAARRRGRLKVFLGMCAGVGKTFAMLEAARRELAAGRDMVIGYVETHGRKETDALTEGLPAIPRRTLEYRGVQLTEFDLDATLARRPQLVLVDEFAHTNAPGSRHPKRCQDVLELLDAGIDVFTTLNVQHLESRAEAVRQISGITIHETVPDTALDGAELELVDLPPDELRARLSAGKVYLPDRAATAQGNFFRPGNLSALRELALRFVAEHVGQDVRDYRLTHGIADPWKSGQRLLVAVSPSPTSASLVRWACRLAGELKAPWVAAYVEPPRPLDTEEQKRLAEHLALARQLGAEIITTSDRDVVAGLLRVAREQNVTQLVVGKPAGWRALDLWRGGSFLNRLIQASGDIDVHAVRAEGVVAPPRGVRPPAFESWDWRGLLLALGSVAGVTGVGLLLKPLTGYPAIALVYLLAVVVLGLFVRRGAVFIASLLSALLWNFLFVPPLFTFRISSAPDWMSFLALLVVGLVVGQLTARLRAQQLAERSREQRATALYLLTRQFAQSADLVQLLGIIVRQVGEAFRADIALALPEESSDAPLTPYFASTWALPEKELSVAVWAFQHRQPAGRSTDTLASAQGLHLPLVAGERAAGVLSLRFHDVTPLPPAQRDLLDAFIRQIALVLDRQRLRDAETQAKLLAESERLGKTLLNSVSHELRTPLAAISSAVSGLREAGPLTPAQQNLAGELDEAAARLDRLVRNLLDLSRLEAGHLRANLDWHDLRDVVRSATDYLGRALSQHPVKLNLPPDLPPVKLDFALTEQILANLLGNAARHTPPGTDIEVRARLDPNQLIIEVADHGPGLPHGDPMRLFDRFQRGPGATAGGTGLGLSLVKGFTETQGGTMTAANRAEGGAVFTVRLPLVALPPLPEEKE
ncbi:MAG: sensor histidine kinase KdpD [Verrucomicrobia bacterium]|nr:sensor histidine kinase KdpD [Verrucomicrobiota bacterium]